MKKLHTSHRAFILVGFLAFGVLWAMVPTTYAASIVVDEFEEIADAQILNVTLATSPQQSTLDHASILGGERDAQVVVTAGAGTMTTNTSDPGGFFNHSQPVGLRGRSILTWDGNDNNGAVLNATGLGGVNLVAPTNDAFLLGVISADLTSQLQILVYSSAANFSVATVNIPAGTSQVTFPIPFSSFVISGGTGANFSNVGAIQMIVNSAATPTAALDLVLDFLIAGESTNFMDLGDLPDSYGTTIASNGPRHSTSNLFLGAIVDTDTDGAPSPTAAGDDGGDGSDDEDGVSQGDWANGSGGGQLTVVLGGSDPSACVNGWMDFNNDGDFGDVGEQILDMMVLPTSGANTINFNIPAGTFPRPTPGILTFNSRFRVVKDVFGDAFCLPQSGGGDEADAASTGVYVNGEVEDYQFFTLDYGDLPAAYNNTNNANNGARHIIGSLYLGASIDSEVEGKVSAGALGDDATDGVDDEDGIAFVSAATWGDGTSDLNVTIGGGPGCLVGWADYNGDGDFSDDINDGVGTVSERMFSQPLASGTILVNTPAPRSSVGGGTFVYPALLNMRFRLFSLNDPLFIAAGLTLTGGCPNGTNSTAQMAAITIGQGSNGEVEDYQVAFTPTAVTLNQISVTTPPILLPVLAVMGGLLVMVMVVKRRKPVNR